MFCDVLVRTKSCGVLIQVSSSDVSDDVNLKRGLFCWVLKTCVPLSKTDLAELLSAAAWSENVFPEHSAVEWGDVQLPQLPSVFYSLLFFASSYSSSTSGWGFETLSEWVSGRVRAAAHG